MTDDDRGQAYLRETRHRSDHLVGGRMDWAHQPDWFKTYCQKQIGLRTDYQPRVPPPGPDTQPYPKDGLAVSPKRRLPRPSTTGNVHTLYSSTSEAAWSV